MRRGMMFLVPLLAVLSGAWGRAQQATQQARAPEVISITLHPAPATRPSLAFRLLPDLVDQRPGNAAPLYLTAARIGPDPKASDDLTGKLGDRFREMPMNELAGSNVEAALQPFAERMRMLDIAARREEAVWEST